MKSLRIGALTCFLALPIVAASWKELTDQAEQSIRSGDRQAALDALQQASVEGTTSAAAQDRIGFLLAVLQDASAANHFRQALQLDPTYSPAHYHLGIALWNDGQQDPALAELQTAVKLAPAEYEYHFYLGSAYLKLNRFADAIPELRRATEIDSKSVYAWTKLGQALDFSGDLAGAATAYETAVGLQPQDNTLRNTYAYLLIETRRAEQGIAEAQKITADNPRDTSAWMNIGYAYLKLGKFAEAEQAYRHAVEIDKYLAAAHYDLGIALKSQDRLEDAKHEFEEAISLDASLAQAHYTLGLTDWQMGDFAGLTAEMRQAIAILPGYAEAHYMLGIALKENGDSDGALKELHEAIRLDPTTPGPWNTIAQILRSKGDKEGSQQAFAKGNELKRAKEAQLSSAFDEGMRGGTVLNPMANTPQKPVGAPQ